jgi:exopolysaccharide biosynthesis polyprenyl glycosylphosphotransferase
MGTKYQWRVFQLALVISDIAMIGLALRLAYFIRFYLDLPIFQTQVDENFPFYQGISLALIPFWGIIFALNSLYNRRNLLGGIQEYSLVFRAVSIGFLTVVIIGFLDPGFILARGWLMLAWVFSFLFVSSARFVLRRVAYALRHRGYFLSPALLVGVNDEALSLAQQLVSWKLSGLHVIGFVDDKVARDTQVHRHLRVLGTLDDMPNLIAEHDVQELILATSAISRTDIVNIFRQFGFVNDLNLRLSSGLFEIVTTGLQIKELGNVSLVQMNPLRMTGVDRVLKLIVDYAITIPILILLMPLFIIISLIIKLDSSGPIFHRRRVMGLHGQQFDAFKFRTMYINGDEILEACPELMAEFAINQKLKEDPRVTRVGRFLRKFSLDELPQLFNVMRREMSVVGPRIISPEEMPRYSQWGMNLLTVYPGITGLWQVSGRSDLSFEERVQLDMHFIRNWTIWLDLLILVRTVPVVFKGRGAY